MDPVTHFMTGAVLSRAGFNRKVAYATLAMTLAAEAPDLDVLWGFKGPVAAFEHHRGWTHAFIGLPIEAAVVTGVVWMGHRLLGGREDLPRRAHTELERRAPKPPAPRADDARVGAREVGAACVSFIAAATRWLAVAAPRVAIT